MTYLSSEVGHLSSEVGNKEVEAAGVPVSGFKWIAQDNNPLRIWSYDEA